MNQPNQVPQLSEVSQELKKWESQGYLFHGSHDPNIEEFEPRHPEGTDKNERFNYDKAVFASPFSGSTVLFAILDRSKLPAEIRSGTWSINWLEDGRATAKIPFKWKTFLEEMEGYVYIMPPQTFIEKTQGQSKSKVPVKPFAKIKVTLQNYFELGGEIEWTD